MKEKKETQESKYIQQHLANERTYLAWIRTAIAIIGIGFLATTLHYNTPLVDIYDQTLAIFISIFSLLLGLLTIVLATLIYLRNRKNINTQTFHSSFKLIIFMTTVIAFILLVFAIYYLVL
ncbi:YidH family protein [Alkalihalobacterium sp. APHAB7]|uniref:YidH family protein n=1 Tax=Alkalihalobacterium sp. APHAB7 TaxID=3402081 RepID=UPI003AAD32A7